MQNTLFQTISSRHWNINITHPRHFTPVYLFGDSQTTVDKGTAQEPSISLLSVVTFLMHGFKCLEFSAYFLQQNFAAENCVFILATWKQYFIWKVFNTWHNISFWRSRISLMSMFLFNSMILYMLQYHSINMYFSFYLQ